MKRKVVSVTLACVAVIVALILGQIPQTADATIVNQNQVVAPSTGFVAANGVQIYYKSFGQGEPLLLINGGPGFPSNVAEPVARELAKHNRVIIYDQRGTGRSQLERLNASTVNMELMVADIEALRSQLKINSWSVMGNSFGGVLGMFYAIKYPANIERLILSASGGIDYQFTQFIPANINARLCAKERQHMEYLEKKLEANQKDKKAAEELRKLTFSAYVYFPKNLSPLLRTLDAPHQFVSTVNYLIWQDLSKQKYNLAPKLKDFNKPVLIIQGRQDFLGESTALNIHQAIPKSQLVLINEAGHVLWLDQKEKYFTAIEQFLIPSRK